MQQEWYVSDFVLWSKNWSTDHLSPLPINQSDFRKVDQVYWESFLFAAAISSVFMVEVPPRDIRPHENQIEFSSQSYFLVSIQYAEKHLPPTIIHCFNHIKSLFFEFIWIHPNSYLGLSENVGYIPNEIAI